MNEQQAIKALKDAIRNEGSHPRHHREIMKKHRQEWPTLWAAIDALVSDKK